MIHSSVPTPEKLEREKRVRMMVCVDPVCNRKARGIRLVGGRPRCYRCSGPIEELWLVPASTLEAAEAREDALREGLQEVFRLAAVSWEGDPWYAEVENLDGEAILGRARSLLSTQEGTND